MSLLLALKSIQDVTSLSQILDPFAIKFLIDQLREEKVSPEELLKKAKIKEKDIQTITKRPIEEEVRKLEVALSELPDMQHYTPPVDDGLIDQRIDRIMEMLNQLHDAEIAEQIALRAEALRILHENDMDTLLLLLALED